jgi:nucleoside-triphosphatase THEP1
MNNQSLAPFAAVVYTAETVDRKALLRFVEKQKALQTRVGGVLQEAIFDENGLIIGLNAVDIATGDRIPITRPVKKDGGCGLDVSALVQTAAIINNAIDDRLDLVVVEKFGELEQNGQGLIDEILQTIAAGIPLLISVPESALPLWQDRSGEFGAVLPFNEEALRQWWQDVTRQRQTLSPNSKVTQPGFERYPV